jgi:hypothetical protein
MHQDSDRETPLRTEPDDIHAEYERAAFSELSDAQLFDRAAGVVSIPRRDAANSFVLHAPLELMARRLLLPHVAPRFRRAVRERMAWVATSFERAGDPVEPAQSAGYDSVADARDGLLGALFDGDLERIDGTSRLLLDRASADEVLALAGPTIDRLAAAGHAPIAFFLAGRLATTSRSSLTLLRPILRELGRAPQLRVEWVGDAHAPAGSAATFTTALANTPPLGLPGSDFVFPIVHQADRSGLARHIIDASMPAHVAAAATSTLRVAARSMLQDNPDYAPYGWTHCLTLPHAIFEIVPWLPDAHLAAAIAATYVVAFRAAEGSHPLEADWEPEATSTNLLDALDAGTGVAQASWYHAEDAAVAEALPELIGRAACHEDAHVVKYTLACLAAAERDRAQRKLYLAAAASLAAWWAGHPDTTFREDR